VGRGTRTPNSVVVKPVAVVLCRTSSGLPSMMRSLT
jgi:hypothetical protein